MLRHRGIYECRGTNSNGDPFLAESQVHIKGSYLHYLILFTLWDTLYVI